MAADPVADLKKKANAAIGRGDLAQALSLLSEALAAAPSDRALWANRAYVHELCKEPALALSDAHAAIELDRGFSKGYLRAARALVALGRSDEAYEAVAAVIDRFPQVSSHGPGREETYGWVWPPGRSFCVGGGWV